jgi:hypothetical protein
MYTDLMALIRRLAVPIAALWFLVQAATLIAVPAYFVAGSGTAPIECTCVHDGNHRDCPMHHASTAGARICLQTMDSTGFVALGSLLGQIALAPPHAQALDLVPAPLAPALDTFIAPLRPAAPEPPPPRV